MLTKFDEQAQKAIVIAESIAFDLGHNNVGSEHLLLSLLRTPESKLRELLQKKDINETKIYDDIVGIFGKDDSQPFFSEYSDVLKNILENAVALTKEKNKKKVSLDILSYSLLLTKDSVALELLKKYKINIDDLKKKLNTMTNDVFLIAKDMIKKNKLEGYISILQPSKKKVILGRDAEVKQILCGLACKEKSNVCLLGLPGVGKTAIVEELARIIKYENIPLLSQYVVLTLHLGNAISNTKYRGEYEEKITKAINAIHKGKYILFIDEGHSIMKSGSDTSMEVSDILKPYLARDNFKCIISTTTREYDKFIASDGAFSRRFKNIFIQEPDDEKLLAMVQEKIKSYSEYHKVRIRDEDVKSLIHVLHRVKNRTFPDKLLDVVDMAMASAKLNRNKEIDLNEAYQYIDSMVIKSEMMNTASHEEIDKKGVMLS